MLTTTLLRTAGNGDLTILTAKRRRLTITTGALASAEAAGLDIDGDIDTIISRLAALPITDEDGVARVRTRLLDDCLDGVETTDGADRVRADWTDYVDTVMAFATGPDDREPA